MSRRVEVIREHKMNMDIKWLDKVYYKDARSMDEIPDNSVHLIITSPPYWNIKDYQKDGHQNNLISKPIDGQIGDIDDFGEYILALGEVWEECTRVLVPNGKLCINTPLMPLPKKQVNTHYNRDIVDINGSIEQQIIRDIKELHLYDMYIWNRTNPSKKLMFGSYPYPRNFYAQNTTEFITIFVKEGKPEKLRERADIKCITDEHKRMKRIEKIKEKSKLTEEEWVEFTKQIWNIPIPSRGDVAYGEHAAIMPDEIPKRLIRLFTYVGDIVLDPFAGSGTTLKMAKLEERHYVGYEINKHYKNLIEKKLAITLKLTHFF